MKTPITKHAVVVLMLVLFPGLSIWSTPLIQAEDLHKKGTMVLAPIEDLRVPIGELAVMASGAAEDTLKACRARIPELASVGQHMLAEQSCAGEEAARKATRSAPKF